MELFWFSLLSSLVATALASKNVTQDLYCTKQISADNNLESQLQEPEKGKHCGRGC